MPLSGIDSTTYHIIDSISRTKEMEKKIRKIDALVSGYIPVSIFNVYYRKYVSYNKFEGFRLGAGLMTNDKVGSFFSLAQHISRVVHPRAHPSSCRHRCRCRFHPCRFQYLALIFTIVVVVAINPRCDGEWWPFIVLHCTANAAMIRCHSTDIYLRISEKVMLISKVYRLQ